MATADKGTSDFLATFKTSPKLLKKAKAMKDAKDPNARPEIPDGNYVAKFTSATLGSRKGVPNVRIRFTVSRGPFTGTLLSTTFDLGITKVDPKKSEEENDEFLESILNRFAVAMQRMGVKTKMDGPDTIVEAVKEVNSLSPTMDVTVKTGSTGYLTVYINRKVADEASKVEDEVETEDDDALEVVKDEDEGGEDDGTDTPSSEGVDEDDDSPGVPPVEVDDVVWYKPKGAKKKVKFKVIKTDPDARVCSLKNEEGGVVKGVSWDAVQFVFDENPN